MTSRISSMVVHITNTLSKPWREDIEQALAEKPNIFEARFADDKSHLMVVHYDPENTSSFEIMTMIERQSVQVQRVS